MRLLGHESPSPPTGNTFPACIHVEHTEQILGESIHDFHQDNHSENCRNWRRECWSLHDGGAKDPLRGRGAPKFSLLAKYVLITLFFFDGACGACGMNRHPEIPSLTVLARNGSGAISSNISTATFPVKIAKPGGPIAGTHSAVVQRIVYAAAALRISPLLAR